MTAKISSSSKLALALILSVTLSQAFAQPNKNAKPADTQTRKTESTPSFAVKVNGHGAPLILIPGLSSSGDTWTTTVAHLQDRYTCHVLTLAGFAGQPPIHGPLLSTVSADLARIIHEKHANNVFWVSGFEVAIISNMEWHSKDCEGLGSGFVVGCKAENDYKIRHLD